MSYRKKLIEVALPLQAINDAAAYDKMPGIGPHPKGLHQWWARLPLPAARAILFATLVDDPSSNPKYKNAQSEIQDKERERIFNILRKILGKSSHDNKESFELAHKEIMKSIGAKAPVVCDPFCGGGSILLEAQRLGLKTYGSDLNQVATLITKITIELLDKFYGQHPINPESKRRLDVGRSYEGLSGIAEDLNYYSKIIYEKFKSIQKSVYPDYILNTKRYPVIAWRWARTMTCPNPACEFEIPLVRSFFLSQRKKKRIWITPTISNEFNNVNFSINHEIGDVPKGTITGNGARCLNCGIDIPFKYIRLKGREGKIRYRLISVICDGPRGRIYFPPSEEHENIALNIIPANTPTEELPEKALGFRVQAYGYTRYSSLYTSRQLSSLTILSELIQKEYNSILNDAINAGLKTDNVPFENGGSGANSYADVIATLLAFIVDRCAGFNNAFCPWAPTNEKVMHIFGRQTISMLWDFGEANILGDSVGSWLTCSEYIAKCLNVFNKYFPSNAVVAQADATKINLDLKNLIMSTDPPYYDNIGYSALSDFFYVWLKKCLKDLYPDLFNTILTPKNDELTASPYRFNNDKEAAKKHFETGFKNAFLNIKRNLDYSFPLTVYYAFKQTDIVTDDKERASTGWESMLDGLISAGFQITATWPIRAAQQWRMRAMDSNALASYIVLACRPRIESASLGTRREFIQELSRELHQSYHSLMEAGIAPVDLQQAAIGPGMALFSKFSKVIEADGDPMTVRTALQLINAQLDRIQENSEIEMDSETRFCIQWFDNYGYEEKPYGAAETLAVAKDISVEGLIQSGVFVSGKGKAKLRHWEYMPTDWDPRYDKRLTLWECTHHLVRVIMKGGGQREAAVLAKYMGNQKAEDAKELAYLLYHISDKREWFKHAGDYNTLITNWQEIKSLLPEILEEQPDLF